jgi:hypothetical protein
VDEFEGRADQNLVRVDVVDHEVVGGGVGVDGGNNRAAVAGRLVRTQPRGCAYHTPHKGQQRARSSPAPRTTSGLPLPSSCTKMTSTPANPSRRVIPLTKPVTFRLSVKSEQLG